MRPVVVTTSATLVSAPPDVWPLVTDTDRMNRLLSSAVTYRPVEEGAKTSARFVVEARAGAFTLEYEEAPFEWVVEERFSVYRKMRSGPLLSYTYSTTLEPTADGGTKVDVRLELVPRHWLLRPIVHIQARQFVSRAASLAEAVDAHLRDSAPSPFLEPTSPANEERIAYAARELAKRSLDAAVVKAVLEFVRTAPDADLVRLRPFELAERMKLDHRETLRVLLHAVTLGVVELRWALVCPSCRTANDQVSSLSAIGDASHCQLCDITYGIELDRAVEATFRPHPNVRAVPDKMFCIGGPWRTPHVLVQANVDAGATRDVTAPAEPARYRLFARGGVVASLEVAEGAPAEAKLSLTADAFDPADLRIAPRATLHVANASGEPVHVKLERLGYATLAATAHEVTTMSEFRRLFSRELLKPSTPLRVGHCAILFSDLTGSTALYTHAGDAAAFRFVDDHFDVLRKAIADAGGTVVKTMGDAIMAAFVDPRACTRAAMASLRAFEAFRGTHENGHLTGLKIGFYAGPCYVITANETIDYFGQTVNCASRVQHLAESGEIILEAHVFDELSEADRAGLRVVERFETKVKGVDEPLALVRTRLAASAAAAA